VKRLAVIGGAAAILNLALISPALAAAPSNDTYAGRTIIGSVPFSDTVDTTEATVGALDANMNAECGAPATDASVWYQMTPASDTTLLVDVSASSYSAGVIVATGSTAAFSVVTCGPDAVAFFAESGVRYTILAFDDQLDGAGNGGTLEITVDTAPPPPAVDITVDEVAHFNATTGSATVTGTVTCIGEAFDTFIEVDMRQRVGRLIISGFGGTGFSCDGTTQDWSVEVFPDNGLFKGGQTATVTFGVACGQLDCGVDVEVATIKLRH
jgi:hypothetical protein